MVVGVGQNVVKHQQLGCNFQYIIVPRTRGNGIYEDESRKANNHHAEKFEKMDGSKVQKSRIVCVRR